MTNVFEYICITTVLCSLMGGSIKRKANNIWFSNLTGVGRRLEDFLNFLSWDPSLFDPSDSVDSLTYQVLVAACMEANSTFDSTQTHSLAAHWKQRNWQQMKAAHKANRREKQEGGEEHQSGRGLGVSSSPTDITGERDARPPPPPPPPPAPPVAAVKPRPGLIPA